MSKASVMPGANAWGCESSNATSQYVLQVATNAAGGVIVTTQNIKDLPSGSSYTTGGTVTLFPMANATTLLTAADYGVSIYKWRCGSSTDGTTAAQKFLPGSCCGN